MLASIGDSDNIGPKRTCFCFLQPCEKNKMKTAFFILFYFIREGRQFPFLQVPVTMNDSLRADIQWRNRKTFDCSTCDLQFQRSRYISHTPTTYGKRRELYTRRRVCLLVWKSNITHSLTAYTTAPVYRRVSMNVLYNVNTTAVRFDAIHFSYRQNTLAI